MARVRQIPSPTFRVPLALMVALALPATAALALTEFWVDGPGGVQIGNDMQFPDAAVDRAGNAIFVWNSSPGTDSQDIYFRRFGPTGTPLANPAIVNGFTTKIQTRARIALARDDSFLVVWESGEDVGGGVYRFEVRCQAFDAGGAKVGSDQYVSTLNTNIGSVIQVDVAALAGGGYVVVWPSAQTSGNDASGQSIQARRVSASGVPQGSQFQVNTTTGGAQSDPSVEALDDGGYLVVFTSPNTGVGPEVRGRRFASNGSAVGNDVRLNTTTTGTKAQTEVVRGWDGRLLVLWKDEEGLGQSGEIRARLFVTWQSVGSVGPDASNSSIQQRVVTGPNQFLGAQMQLNVFATSDQREPGSGGRYGQGAVAWRSNGNADDAANHAITGELWQSATPNGQGCVFCDDLEWGTTTRWSSANP